VALYRKKFTVGQAVFSYHACKESLFFNPVGIEQHKNYFLAGPERAVCDTLYLWPQTGFDQVQQLNAERLLQIAEIYQVKSLKERVKAIAEQIKEQRSIDA
jgi:hypothetical protein